MEQQYNNYGRDQNTINISISDSGIANITVGSEIGSCSDSEPSNGQKQSVSSGETASSKVDRYCLAAIQIIHHSFAESGEISGDYLRMLDLLAKELEVEEISSSINDSIFQYCKEAYDKLDNATSRWIETSNEISIYDVSNGLQDRKLDSIRAVHAAVLEISEEFSIDVVPSALVRLGIKARKEGDLKRSEACFHKAIELNGDNYPGAYFGLGTIRQEQRNFEDALNNFRKAEELYRVIDMHKEADRLKNSLIPKVEENGNIGLAISRAISRMLKLLVSS